MKTKCYLQHKRRKTWRYEILSYDRRTSTVTYMIAGIYYTYQIRLDDPDYQIVEFDGGIQALVQGPADSLGPWVPYRYCAEIEGTGTDRMRATTLTVTTIKRAASWLA
jgi:hypothetical protein